jgi:hypothetical protein
LLFAFAFTAVAALFAYFVISWLAGLHG